MKQRYWLWKLEYIFCMYTHALLAKNIFLIPTGKAKNIRSFMKQRYWLFSALPVGIRLQMKQLISFWPD